MELSLAPVRRWYKGIAFRSSLEADWACTLDFYRIRWKYEPQAFQLPSGDGYVPDFWMPEIGTHLEVKGDGVPGKWKACDLARMAACQCDGPCSCDWPGGQIVIIGRAAVRSSVLDSGFALNWQDPINHNTPFGQCRKCGAWCWIRLRNSLDCRRCGTRMTGHLHPPGEVEPRFADRNKWTVAR